VFRASCGFFHLPWSRCTRFLLLTFAADRVRLRWQLSVSSPHAERATYYRTALLLGLVDGAVVRQWAQAVIEHETNPSAAFFDLVSVDPADLSALRNALWPLVIEPEPPTVLRSLFARLAADLTAGPRGITDTITILRQMRSLLRLPPDIYAGLNAAFVAQSREGQDDAIVRWLQQFADGTAPGP
jgi:hypothetical protein